MKWLAIIFAVLIFQSVLVKCDEDDEDDDDENQDESDESENEGEDEDDDSDEDDEGNDSEHFLVEYRFLAHNKIELKMTLDSAEKMLEKLQKSSQPEFHKYYDDFITPIKKKDKNGAGGSILKSDYDNIRAILTACPLDFKKAVDELKAKHKPNDTRRIYVISYRSYTCNDFSNKGEVFVVM